MKFVQYAVCALLVVVSTLSAGAQQNTLLPVRAVPHGMQLIEVNGGGRILYGRMIAAKSADAAIRSGFDRMKTYFPSVQFEPVMRFPVGDQLAAGFSAKLDGHAIRGLAVSVKDAGGARFGVAFDETRRFQQNSPLIIHLLAVAMKKMAPTKVSSSGRGSLGGVAEFSAAARSKS